MESFQGPKIKIRNTKFLKSFNPDKLKRKREEDIIELRKQKRIDQLVKKRFLLKQTEEVSPEPYIQGSEYINFSQSLITKNLSEKCPELLNLDLIPSERLFLLIKYIQNLEDPSDLLDPIKTLRHVLSQDRTCPINLFMSTGISTKLIKTLNLDSKDLQIECLWCLINLASGPPHIIKKLFDNNIKDPLKKLLNSDDPELLHHTIWCIGNLVGDSSCPRFALIELIPLLVDLINKIPQDRWKNIIWALSNFCRGKPYINREATQQILTVIPKLLKTNDDDLITDSCWTLSFMSSIDAERVQDIVDIEILSNLVGILNLEPGRFTLPSLRIIGNILWGSDQAQKILELGFLDCVNKLLTQKKIALKKEILWILSNITSGSDEQIKQVLNHSCIGIVIKCLEDPDIEIRNEAIWVISNATNAQDKNLVLKIIEIGAFPLICEFLNFSDSKVIMVVLEGIDNLLWAGSGFEVNDVALKLDEIGGLNKIEALQHCRNLKVYNKVVEIMEKYWGVDEVEVVDEALLAIPQTFSFN
ncbi:hypothetical protein SteCoe_33310 [Stentor coeruleus]|uniref:Importin subunit alpha n=1 Tax=Stentor coeruleus TaxID=5963 RepID=A0A1R2AX12_9CILI|nr:hypothetical protein SteCoe_33310 [Stentor coeruleus]